MASWIDEEVGRLTESLRAELVPTIERVQTSSRRLAVGDTLDLEVECSDNLMVFLEGDHPGLYVQKEQGRSYTFVARESSSNRFQVSVVDPDTLLSSKEDVLITID